MCSTRWRGGGGPTIKTCCVAGAGAGTPRSRRGAPQVVVGNDEAIGVRLRSRWRGSSIAGGNALGQLLAGD